MIALVKFVVKIRKTPLFEKIFPQVEFFSGFLLHEYRFTVILKRSSLYREGADPELSYFKTQLIELTLRNLLYVIHSTHVEKILFVNKKNGLASLDCALHESKYEHSLNFFFWTDDIKL